MAFPSAASRVIGCTRRRPSYDVYVRSYLGSYLGYGKSYLGCEELLAVLGGDLRRVCTNLYSPSRRGKSYLGYWLY